MRRVLLVLVLVLSLGAVASAAQPWEILLQAAWGDSSRGGLHVAAPVLGGQIFVETPGVGMASYPEAEVYQSAAGAKVFPTAYPVYVGAGYWTAQDTGGAGEWSWLLGGRVSTKVGFTAEVSYAGVGSWRFGLGASF